jgi:hypothetical protein
MIIDLIVVLKKGEGPDPEEEKNNIGSGFERPKMLCILWIRTMVSRNRMTRSRGF